MRSRTEEISRALASATLIGRDIREMVSSDSREYILKILDAEIKSSSRCYLARGIMNELCKGNFTRARTILKCLETGMTGLKPSNKC